MFGYKMSDFDKKVYIEHLADFLPGKIIDVHAHVWKKEFNLSHKHKGLVLWTDLVAEECSIEDLKETYRALFPNSATVPVIMGNPVVKLDDTNTYAGKCVEKYHFKALYCTSHNTSVEEIEKAFSNGFCGIKPYLGNAPSYILPNEIRIFDFLPKEHLEAANRHGAVVMLHISRPNRLRDPLNLNQLLEIEENYPNAKVIIAHIGRAYAPEDLGNAFEILKSTNNMMFDFSANTQALAIAECIKAVGAKRLLFGSDMPITKMRMYRITENGTYYNVVPRGLYKDIYNDPHMRETDEKDITSFIYEQILAFKEVVNELGLNKQDIEDIFYNNAAELFGMKE